VVSPALAAFDVEHDAEAKALLENPFLADLGSSLLRAPSSRVSSSAAATNAASLAGIDDLLGDDALFADLLNTGAASSTPAVNDDDALLASVALLADDVHTKRPASSSPSIPQIDGGTGTNAAASASTATTGGGATVSASSAAAAAASTRLDNTVIGSDDDDDEIIGATAAAEVRDYIVCLYDDVKRAKTKRKLSLLDGVATVQGVDYVFRKGAGECDFQN
jgi:hypothetical protein